MARAFSASVKIPSKAYRAYKAQFESAARRGIEWQFTLDEWWNWWHEYDPAHECVRWEKRGRKMAGCLMMARRKDIGPYSAENVYCATAQQNMADLAEHHNHSAVLKDWHATHDSWLKGNRGDGHPCAKAVMTEMGRFGSIALAAEAAGITRAGGLNRVRIGRWTLC